MYAWKILLNLPYFWTVKTHADHIINNIIMNNNYFLFFFLSLQKSMTRASTHGALDVHQRNGITIWNRPLEDVCPSFTKLSAVPGSNTLYVSSINRLIHYIRFTYMYVLRTYIDLFLTFLWTKITISLQYRF